MDYQAVTTEAYSLVAKCLNTRTNNNTQQENRRSGGKMVIEIENCYCCGQEKVNTKKTTGNRAICNNCHNPMLLSCKHNKGGEK